MMIHLMHVFHRSGEILFCFATFMILFEWMNCLQMMSYLQYDFIFTGINECNVNKQYSLLFGGWYIWYILLSCAFHSFSKFLVGFSLKSDPFEIVLQR